MGEELTEKRDIELWGEDREGGCVVWGDEQEKVCGIRDWGRRVHDLMEKPYLKGGRKGGGGQVAPQTQSEASRERGGISVTGIGHIVKQIRWVGGKTLVQRRENHEVAGKGTQNADEKTRTLQRTVSLGKRSRCFYGISQRKTRQEW